MRYRFGQHSHLRKTVIRSHRRNRCSTQVGVSGDPIPSTVVHYVIGFRCHGQSWQISPELERMIPVADSIEMFESASLFTSEDGIQWSQVSEIGVDDNDEPDFDFTDGRQNIGGQSNRCLLERGSTRHGISERSTVHRLAKIDPECAPLNSPAVRRVRESAGWSPVVPWSQDPRGPLDLLLTQLSTRTVLPACGRSMIRAAN